MATSHRHGTPHCLNCSNGKEWSDLHLQGRIRPCESQSPILRIRSVRFVQVEPERLCHQTDGSKKMKEDSFLIAEFFSGVLNINAAGIDVSSRKSTAAVLRPFGEVVKIPFDIVHNAEGFASLVQQLKSLRASPESLWSILAILRTGSTDPSQSGILCQCGQSAADQGIWRQFTAQG